MMFALTDGEENEGGEAQAAPHAENEAGDASVEGAEAVGGVILLYVQANELCMKMALNHFVTCQSLAE